MTEWTSLTPRCDPATDAIELVDSGGAVRVKLHRNAVIRMIGLLPAEPPRVGFGEGEDP